MSDKKVLGLIPARGNSKGIPHKNIVPLGGKPLIAWVCEEAKKSKLLSKVILSSDDDQIISVAASYGIPAPYKRPENLAEDTSPIVGVIEHALRWFKENQGEEYSHICLLQPTCPLGRAIDYDRAIQKALDTDADTIISVYHCGQAHPATMYTLDKDARADWFVKERGWNRMARRQDLPPVYMRSGIVYVFKASLILDQHALYGDTIYAIDVPPERAVDINTPIDLKLTEVMLKELGMTK